MADRRGGVPPLFNPDESAYVKYATYLERCTARPGSGALHDQGLRGGMTPAWLRRSGPRSCARARKPTLASPGVEQLAVVSPRRLDAPPGIRADGTQRADLDSQLAKLIALRDEGEPVLGLCREYDLAWVPFFPPGSAFPGRPKVTEHPAVLAGAASLGAAPAQVGLAWQEGK